MELVDVQYAANPLFVVTLSKFFMGNHLHVASSLKEAEANSRRRLGDIDTILEPDQP